jgi:hypothetical protein
VRARRGQGVEKGGSSIGCTKYQGLQACEVDSAKAKANRNKRMRSMQSRIGWSRRVAKQQEQEQEARRGGGCGCVLCVPLIFFSLVFFDSPSP